MYTFIIMSIIVIWFPLMILSYTRDDWLASHVWRLLIYLSSSCVNSTKCNTFLDILLCMLLPQWSTEIWMLCLMITLIIWCKGGTKYHSWERLELHRRLYLVVLLGVTCHILIWYMMFQEIPLNHLIKRY